MANLFVTYDLNGTQPSHRDMDEHLRALGPAFLLGRVLETVWYVAGPTNAVALRNYARLILSPDDLLLVLDARQAAWSGLGVDEQQFKMVFEQQPLAV